MEPVRSTRNPRVAEALKLHRTAQRRRHGRTLLEGPHLLTAAVDAHAEVVRVFGLPDDTEAAALARRAAAEWIPVEPQVLDRLAPTQHPRGPVAVVGIPPSGQVTRDCLGLAVTDPGNVGTLIRTAAAFDLDVVVEPSAADPWSPKALRAGAGAHFATVISSWMPEHAGRIATVPRGGVAPADLPPLLDPARPWGILIGAEAQGLPAEVVAAADVVVTIPTAPSVESLNASVAGSVVAYEMARWRKSVGTSPAPD